MLTLKELETFTSDEYMKAEINLWRTFSPEEFYSMLCNQDSAVVDAAIRCSEVTTGDKRSLVEKFCLAEKVQEDVKHILVQYLDLTEKSLRSITNNYNSSFRGYYISHPQTSPAVLQKLAKEEKNFSQLSVNENLPVSVIEIIANNIIDNKETSSEKMMVLGNLMRSKNHISDELFIKIVNYANSLDLEELKLTVLIPICESTNKVWFLEQIWAQKDPDLIPEILMNPHVSESFLKEISSYEFGTSEEGHWLFVDKKVSKKKLPEPRNGLMLLFTNSNLKTSFIRETINSMYASIEKDYTFTEDTYFHLQNIELDVVFLKHTPDDILFKILEKSSTKYCRTAAMNMLRRKGYFSDSITEWVSACYNVDMEEISFYV